MANRYTNLTPSAYTPMTLEEIAMVPAMKRAQHDKVLAQQETIRSGLAKVDPLDVHYEEALKLKQGIEGKMDATAAELSSQGINPDMIGKTLGLNREVQDLISPTGRIGQINAAKAAEAATKKEFMDSPELKEYSLEAKTKAWAKHRAAYTGYDEEGKITNIGMLSAPKYQDMQKDFLELSGRLGEETRTKLQNIGAHFEPGPFGGLVMKSGDGKTINTNNDANLKALAETMAAKYIMPSGEGYKSREFAGYDKKNTFDQLNSMLGIPKVSKEVKDMNYSNQFIGDPNAKTKDDSEGSPTMITDVVEGKETITDNNIRTVASLGNKEYTLSAPPPKGRNEQESDYQKRIKNIKYDPTTKKYKQNVGTRIEDLPPAVQNQVNDIYNAKKAQGKIPKNDKLTDYKPETVKIIADELKRLQFNNFSNQIIVPDSAGNSMLASPQLVGKDAVQRDKFIQTRLYAALNEDSDKQGNVIFNKDGSKVNLDDVDIDSVKLVGHYSPSNKLKQFGGNKDNAISPHMITWKDKDGKQHAGLMPRDAAETNTPEFKAARVIKKTTDKAVDREGNFTSFSYKEIPELQNADLSIFGKQGRGLNGMRVKFNNDKKTYTIELIDKNNKVDKIEVDTKGYQDIMYDMIE